MQLWQLRQLSYAGSLLLLRGSRAGPLKTISQLCSLLLGRICRCHSAQGPHEMVAHRLPNNNSTPDEHALKLLNLDLLTCFRPMS